MPSADNEYLMRIWEWIAAGAHVITSGGGGGGGASTIADGADVAQGSTTDAPVDVVENATPRTVISLLKGIKNYLKTLVIGIIVSAMPKSTYKIEVEVTGLHTPTTAYTAGMVLGFAGPVVLVELPNVVPANGGGGFITGFKISTNKKSIVPTLRIHLFNANTPTVAADRALWEDLYADTPKRIYPYDMPAMSSSGNASTDMSRAMDQTFRPIEFVCAANSRSLWFAFEIGTVGFTPDADQKYNLTVWVNDNV